MRSRLNRKPSKPLQAWKYEAYRRQSFSEDVERPAVAASRGVERPVRHSRIGKPGRRQHRSSQTSCFFAASGPDAPHHNLEASTNNPMRARTGQGAGENLPEWHKRRSATLRRMATTTSEAEAVHAVEACFSQRSICVTRMSAEHTLKRLIQIPSLANEYIQAILECADVLFFGKCLGGRVQVEWSRDAQGSRDVVIGRTELGSAPQGGFCARITLCEPLLQSRQYDNRLLLATLFHEAVHAYLFIQRGIDAWINGGHSPGFVRISQLINSWVGNKDYLQLHKINADLESFSQKQPNCKKGTAKCCAVLP